MGSASRVRVSCRPHIGGAPSVYAAYAATFRDQRHEEFLAILLDCRNRTMRETRIARGALSSCQVHPREAFADAVREGAAGIIFLHNHPSGDPEPSTDDNELTTRLHKAGCLLGIRVVDHVVIGDGGYVSYAERGWLGAKVPAPTTASAEAT
jgi:DNA repair protein RadC